MYQKAVFQVQHPDGRRGTLTFCFKKEVSELEFDRFCLYLNSLTSDPLKFQTFLSNLQQDPNGIILNAEQLAEINSKRITPFQGRAK